MKKIFAFSILVTCVFFISHSCTYSEKPTLSRVQDKQEIIRIIPKNQYRKNFYPYKMVERDTKRTGLNFLDKGYDSMFIRLWYVYRATKQVIDLKKTDGKWSAEFHSMKMGVIEEQLGVVETKSIPISPKSDWNVFMSKLFSLKILDLPDESELPNYKNLVNDAAFVVVEISTKEMYKIYHYGEISEHLEFPQAVNMENIMKLIDEEFGIKRDEKF
ncbi:hypothetical protein [Ferruginibacter sp.]|nr:hypothetical protein [Ferruginibacter sp.]